MAIPDQAGEAGGEVRHLSQAEILAEDAIKGKEITPSQWRKLRAAYFAVRHARVQECGHRFDVITEPRTNCESCWYHWLDHHGELVQTADRAFQEQGKDFLVGMRGKRFVKMFLRFMSTLAHMKQEQDANALPKESGGDTSPTQSSLPEESRQDQGGDGSVRQEESTTSQRTAEEVETGTPGETAICSHEGQIRVDR